MLSTLAPRLGLWASTVVLVVAGCGGGGEAPDPNEGGGDSQPTSGQDAGAGGGSGSGEGGAIGPVTLTTDPGSAWAEVDGGRLEYQASGGIGYECSVTGDRVLVNFQTADGQDLSAQGSNQGEGWFISVTFRQADQQIQYSAASTRGDGTFGIGDGALSYEGTVDRIEGVDIANATEVDARIAINCASAGGASGGGEATATVGGQAFSFPLSGAQSVTCDVAADRVEVRINRLGLDGLQLEVDGRTSGDQWLGAVVVSTNDGSFISTMAPDGTGLTIDGSAVEYAGTFKTPDGSEVDGTASVTCP